jgi:hypothetical protein
MEHNWKGNDVTNKMNLQLDLDSTLGSFSLDLDKDVSIVGNKITSVVTHGIKPIRGKPGLLHTAHFQDLYNPSSVSLKDIGRVSFDIIKNGMKIGETEIHNFNIVPGFNPNIR